MSFNYNNYKHYKANKDKRKGKSDNIIKLASLIFCILMAFMFASIMTGNFFLNVTSNGDFISMEEREYYGISFGSYGTLSQAEKVSSSLRARGGGGYILKGGKYNVFAALYINKADAESVKDRLKNSGTDCSVQKIDIPSYKFEYNSEKLSNKKMKDILELFNFTIENLYSIFIELDGNIINDFDAQSRLNGLKNEIARKKEEYDLSATETNHKVIRLKAELLSLQINLGIITESSYITENTSLEIKYYMLKIVFSYQSFVNEIR